jgi:hypothetical protein
VNQDFKPISSSFTEIKRSLDPLSSYLVFEKTIGSGKEEAFPEVTQVLEHLKKRVSELKLHRDETRGLVLLVAKLEPEGVDEIMQEFLEIGLPKDITFYYYGKRVES